MGESHVGGRTVGKRTGSLRIGRFKNLALTEIGKVSPHYHAEG